MKISTALITGLPGSGKSLLAVSGEIIDEYGKSLAKALSIYSEIQLETHNNPCANLFSTNGDHIIKLV